MTLALLAGLVSRVKVQPLRSSTDRTHARRVRLPGASWGIFGLSTVILAAVTSGGVRPRLFLIGIVILGAGLPGTLRAMLTATGRIMVRRLPNRPAALITGRMLSGDAKRVTRPLVALMAVTVVLPVMMSWVGVARTVDEPVASNGAYTFTLAGPESSIIATNYQNLASTSIVSLTYTGTDTPTASVTNCTDLAALFPGTDCEQSVSFDPNRGVTPPAPVSTAVQSGSVDPRADVHLIFTLDNTATETTLRQLVAGNTDVTLTVPDQRSESPLVAWILGGAAVTLTVTGLGLVVALVAQASQAARQRARLAAIGTPRRFIQQLAAIEALTSILSASAVSLAAGLFLVGIFKRIEPIAPIPVFGVGGLALTAVFLAVITGVAAAVSVGQPSQVWNERNHTGW